MKTLIIIPAYNEAENIERVVNRLINDYPQYDYVIVNDGSKDKTIDICKTNNYNYIDLPVNLGLAGAFRAGMKYALYNNYDYALQFDGDGQHNPEYISNMLSTAQEHSADIVIGSRFVSEKKPLNARMVGSRLIAGCIKLTTRKKIADPTSGMRMYNKKMIKKLAKTMNYGPEPDTVAYLIRCGAIVKETQVTMCEREFGESYLNFSRSISYMAHMCSSILFIQWFRKKEL